MPELFGICASERLSCDVRKGFAAMRRGFLAFRPGSVEVEELNWAAVGALRWHDKDPAMLARGTAPACCCVWVGKPPRSLRVADVAELVGSLSQGDFLHLRQLGTSFASAVMDVSTRSLRVLTDPHGLHPVYYAFQNGTLLFSTKPAPLLQSGLVTWKLDRRAVLDFFSYEHLTGDSTFADSMKTLAPGTILSVERGQLRLCSYLRPEPAEAPVPKSARETAKRLFEGLSTSVSRSLPEAGRVGVTLSGGMDSRALLGLALQHGADVKAYTFGLAGCPDIHYARQITGACKIAHTVVEVDGSHLPKWLDHGIYVTGGMVNCIHYHILALAEILASDADVVLDGLGGDALTGGHLKWGMVLANKPERAIDALYRQRATAWATGDARAELLHPDFLGQTDYDPKDAVRRHFSNTVHGPPWKACHRFDLLERQRRFIQYGPHLLRPLVAVETPFYSRDMVQLMTTAPLVHLMEQRAYLLMHSRHLRSLAGVPDSARKIPVTYPLPVRFGKKVSDFVRRRLRRRLRWARGPAINAPTDYAHWFRTQLREFVQERLLARSVGFDSIIRPQAVQILVREHLDGSADHTVKLGCLLTFDAWCRSAGI